MESSECQALNSSSNKEEFQVNKIIIIPKISTTSTGVTLALNSVVVAKGEEGLVVGASMSYKKSKTGKQFLFRMFDVIVSIIFLLTISIGFWRGIWQIVDYYCELYDINPWVTFVVCNLILFLLYFYQETFQKYIHPNKMNFLLFYIISRVILILHAITFVSQWRGLWVGLDVLFGQRVDASILTFIIPIIIAIFMKIFSNFLATPLYVGIDDAHTVHSCPLRFNTSPENAFKYFWDCFFSIVVVQTLTIISWRGLWCLADVYICPEDLLSSGVVSWIIGNFIVINLCAIQPVYYKWVTKMKGISRLAVMNLVTLIGFVGCVLGWRGCWELFNTLLIFETKLRSEWVSTIFGTLAAMMLGCLSTVVNRGALTDGELAADDSSEWTISYVSLLQERDFTVPFPEPWILRYFCTSQVFRTIDNKSRTTNSHITSSGIENTNYKFR